MKRGGWGGGGTTSIVPGLPVDFSNLGQSFKMIQEELLELLAVYGLEGEVLDVAPHEGLKHRFPSYQLQAQEPIRCFIRTFLSKTRISVSSSLHSPVRMRFDSGEKRLMSIVWQLKKLNLLLPTLRFNNTHSGTVLKLSWRSETTRLRSPQ